MVTLFCALVGAEGSAFPVDIDASKSVGHLKKAIWAEKPNDLKTTDADKLQLYLAKKGDSWLKSSTDDVKKLKKGEKTALIEALIQSDKELQGESGLGGVLTGMPQPSTDQIHVLVVVPKSGVVEEDTQGQQVDSASMFREVSIRQMRLEAHLEQIHAALPHKKPKSYSDAALGQLEIAKLNMKKMIIDAAPLGNGEAFWSQETQDQANRITNEAVFDAFITPFFSSVLASCGMVFVNSERYQWLSQSTDVTKSTDLKPDGFATHPGMFRVKQAPNDKVQRPNGFRFGVAEDELFDCLILFESKLTITDAAFGQVVRYLQNLCPEASASAILFDLHSFWLIESSEGDVGKVQKAMWVNKGSKSLFRNFITDHTSPWVTRLIDACTLFGVDVVEGDAFLGRGAHGRVFKVTRQGREVFALKIVEKSSIVRLYREEAALKKAQHTGSTINPVGELIETPDGAALLLSPVGTSLPHPTTRQEVGNLFRLLWQLHTNGLVHGDPRVPNVIVHGDKSLWIDLVEVMKANPTLKQFDAEILTRSILSISQTVLLDPMLNQLINNYGKSGTLENLNNLAEAVGLFFSL